MNIVLLSYTDIAGQSSILWRGLNDYTDHNARLITFKRNYLAYKEDIYYPERKNEAHDIMDKADLFHVSAGIPQLEDYDLNQRLAERPYVQELHGFYARKNWKMLLSRWFKNGTIYVTHLSTQGVREKIGFSIYIPRSVDFRDFPKHNANPDTIRVCHCPTNRSLKSTTFFLRTMKEVEKKHPSVETVLVEKNSWKECLKIKASCDLVFDHLGKVEQGYGMNSIEAMALGIPALCHMGNYASIYHHDCPVVNVSHQDLMRNIIELIEHDDLRKRVGRQGLKFVKRVHDIKINVKKWNALFHYVLNQKK